MRHAGSVHPTQSVCLKHVHVTLNALKIRCASALGEVGIKTPNNLVMISRSLLGPAYLAISFRGPFALSPTAYQSVGEHSTAHAMRLSLSISYRAHVLLSVVKNDPVQELLISVVMDGASHATPKAQNY